MKLDVALANHAVLITISKKKKGGGSSCVTYIFATVKIFFAFKLNIKVG